MIPLRAPGASLRASTDTAEAIALSALAFLLADDERAERFIQLTNFNGEELKSQLGNPAFLGGVLDFLLEDETLVSAAAEALGLTPEDVAAARRRLPGAAIID